MVGVRTTSGSKRRRPKIRVTHNTVTPVYFGEVTPLPKHAKESTLLVGCSAMASSNIKHCVIGLTKDG